MSGDPGPGEEGNGSEERKGWSHGRGESNVASSGPSPGVELWTGIKKGPPRKLKFPEPQEVVEKLKKCLP